MAQSANHPLFPRLIVLFPTNAIIAYTITMPVTIPKFLTAKGADPKHSTEEYWQRFQYSVISTLKTKPDTLLTRHAASTATGAAANQAPADDETLALEILKGIFLEALGEDAIYEIQQRNPKDKLYD